MNVETAVAGLIVVCGGGLTVIGLLGAAFSADSVPKAFISGVVVGAAVAVAAMVLLGLG